MFIDHQQEQWPEWLGTAEFAYNNKVYAGTKVLPFKANCKDLGGSWVTLTLIPLFIGV